MKQIIESRFAPNIQEILLAESHVLLHSTFLKDIDNGLMRFHTIPFAISHAKILLRTGSEPAAPLPTLLFVSKEQSYGAATGTT